MKTFFERESVLFQKFMTYKLCLNANFNSFTILEPLRRHLVNVKALKSHFFDHLMKFFDYIPSPFYSQHAVGRLKLLG